MDTSFTGCALFARTSLSLTLPTLFSIGTLKCVRRFRLVVVVVKASSSFSSSSSNSNLLISEKISSLVLTTLSIASRMETIVKVEFWGVISQQSSGFGGSNAAAFFCCCFVCGY
jgi:hypothetical protein